MSAKLYVGNLPWSVTEEDLKSHFASVVDVQSATIITDRETGKSRGFGFVEVSDSQKAIEAFNGQDFNGRRLTVNEARERPSRGGGGYGGGSYGGGGYGGGGYSRNRGY